MWDSKKEEKYNKIRAASKATLSDVSRSLHGITLELKNKQKDLCPIKYLTILDFWCDNYGVLERLFTVLFLAQKCVTISIPVIDTFITLFGAQPYITLAISLGNPCR